MPTPKHYPVTVEFVCRKIRYREGFDVCFRNPHNNKKVPKNKIVPVQYPDFERTASDNLTVTAWRRNRFHSTFPNYKVDVLDVEGRAVGGGTKLWRVRDTYREF
jgi:hypothetical protein